VLKANSLTDVQRKQTYSTGSSYNPAMVIDQTLRICSIDRVGQIFLASTSKKSNDELIDKLQRSVENMKHITLRHINHAD
jgi:hypothetical protein